MPTHAQSAAQARVAMRVQFVPALDRDDLALRPCAQQREVADQIEHLVAHRFVGPAHRLHRPVGCEDQRVFEASASRQTALSTALRPREGSRTYARRRSRADSARASISPSKYCVPIGAGNRRRSARETRRGNAATMRSRSRIRRTARRASNVARVRFASRAGRRRSHRRIPWRSVADRNLGPVDADLRVADAHAKQRGEQVFGRRDRRAVASHDRRARGLYDVLDDGRDSRAGPRTRRRRFRRSAGAGRTSTRRAPRCADRRPRNAERRRSVVCIIAVYSSGLERDAPVHRHEQRALAACES